ncbi:MAG: hypothetical protein KJ957_03700 [Candidatus Omnitrophica bacterium]|nr:hypothetical protein [Candidatus Omnitrophota bacterium]
MPRQPRIDYPGILHHVIGRGIEKRKIFKGISEKESFLSRLSELLKKAA